MLCTNLPPAEVDPWAVCTGCFSSSFLPGSSSGCSPQIKPCSSSWGYQYEVSMLLSFPSWCLQGKASVCREQWVLQEVGVSLIHTPTPTPTPPHVHVNHYLYTANGKPKCAKHKRTKDRNPFRVISSIFISVTLRTNILVSCVAVQPHMSQACVSCSVKKYWTAS